MPDFGGISVHGLRPWRFSLNPKPCLGCRLRFKAAGFGGARGLTEVSSSGQVCKMIIEVVLFGYLL